MEEIKGISLINYMAGTGKDTVADIIVNEFGYKKYALADGIYEIARKYYGMTKKDRELIIHIGESLRKKDPMLWINYTMQRIKKDGCKKVIISDIRKPLEKAFFEEIGFHSAMVKCDEQVALQRIKDRDGVVNEDIVLNSRIENALRNSDVYVIENNKGIELLHMNVIDFMNQEMNDFSKVNLIDE